MIHSEKKPTVFPLQCFSHSLHQFSEHFSVLAVQTIVYKNLHVHRKKHEKCLEPNTVTQTTSCDKIKNESHPLFHQSVTQLTTVKLGFDQIRTMTCVFSGFRCRLLFLVLFLVSPASAKPGNNANSTPVSSSATKHCSYVYNSFYAGSNKKIETILQEIKNQIAQLQDDINIPKGNKTTVKGKICFLLNLELCLFSNTFGISNYGTHE